MSKKVKIGDIIEIPMQKGLAYVQYHFFHDPPPRWGYMVRVLPGFFQSRPTDFEALANLRESYFIFCGLQRGLNQRLGEIVANVPIPVHAQKFPLFRYGFMNMATGKEGVWRLWDGVKEWRIDTLTDEQLDYSLLRLISFDLLAEEIEEGWTPRRAQEFLDRARAKRLAEQNDPDRPKQVEEMRHFLVFPDEKSAAAAREKIAGLGWQAGMKDLDDAWGVNVLQPDLSDSAIARVEKALEKLAAEFGGEYDGNGFQLSD
jgi:Regulator of ribonuclease activity B